MEWKAFLTDVLAAHGKRISIPTGKPPKVGFVEGWALEAGSTLTVMLGQQTFGFRADDGFVFLLQDEHILISREKPMHEAMYVFYPHVAAIRVQKADLQPDSRDD